MDKPTIQECIELIMQEIRHYFGIWKANPNSEIKSRDVIMFFIPKIKKYTLSQDIHSELESIILTFIYANNSEFTHDHLFIK